MIFEQAFYSLPEVLHGSGYQKQDYEAGIISAFTLSVLQVLNGRNVNNPIGCINAEKLFRPGGQYHDVADPRYLRADLFIDISRMYVANKRLGQYGWRHNLWLEGKFLRGQVGNGNQHCSNKTNYVAMFLADIVRLSTLVPENAQEQQSKTGRYFLHVYDAHPKYYLTFKSRPWCKAICTPGTHDIEINSLENEPDSVKNLLGQLPELNLKLNITTIESVPLTSENKPVYWCYLTRINSIVANISENNFSINLHRNITGTQDSIQNIAAYVASRINITKGSPELTPVIEDEDIIEQDNNV